MSSRLWLCSAVLILASAGQVSAQGSSPLDLARGIREAGMPDLALEYLKEIENTPLADDDKKALGLERAKCLLDAAEDEPDEGSRMSMVGEAKDGFRDFLIKSPSHPRAAEASISLARLTSIDAKTQLNKARRIEVGDDTDLKKKQEEESAAARPLFLQASKLFADAAQQIKAKLADPSLDGALRISLSREAFDADLAAAINQYNLASTYLGTDAKTVTTRAETLEKARTEFGKLAKGPTTSRTSWVAKAWMAEMYMDQSKFTEGETEFKAILAVNMLEASEGKRFVRFFMARRNYLSAISDRTPTKLQAAEKELGLWLSSYGGGKTTPEAIATRYYLAYCLQMQAQIATPIPKTGPLVVGETAKNQFRKAEQLYRLITQTDNDYTARAQKYRMYAVRMVLGEADQPPSAYVTFETAQMAALIQMAKLADVEKDLPKLAARAEDQAPWTALRAELRKRKAEAEIKHRQLQIQLLLERARELANDKDSHSDVVDNLLRLIYYYTVNNQPYQAAVLGEHMARTVKSTGGKSAHAGLLGMNGYVIASRNIKIKVDATDPNNKEAMDAVDAIRKGDRERAMALARYLDEKFPNDTPTDAARHRLAAMLIEDKKYAEAFGFILKVRPGYSQIAGLRLLEGYIANLLITTAAKDVPLPPGGKPFVFARAIADLNRVAKPATSAREEEVVDYFSVRARLAFLYLAQSRLEDKKAEAEGPGYEKSLAIANEMIGSVPSFDCFKGTEAGKLTVKGMEMDYLGLDARARALYLRGKAFVDAADANLEKAAAAIEPSIEDVEKNGVVYNDTMKSWQGADEKDPLALDKSKVAALAQAIDKTRRDIVMLGFKLRVRQGKPAEATKMLDLLVKAGGSIEDNQSTLELMARDLAVHIGLMKKAKQDTKAMGEGLTILLKKLGTIPNLTSSSIVFLGQTLYLVEQYEDALKEFTKIPLPVPPKGSVAIATTIPPKAAPNKDKEPAWWEVDQNKLPNNPDKKKFQDDVQNYRKAQLYTAKCLHGLNKFPDAEKLLTGAIGTADKTGYAYSNIDFRKEFALVYESVGASIADPKLANQEWGKALKEWTTLFNFARAEVSRLKEGDAQERQVKSRYYDMYFEVQRCLVQANSQILKGNPKLEEKINKVGKDISDMENSNKFAELEKKGMGIITPDVWNHYCDLLDKYPQLKNGYKAANGKFFLERPRE